MIQKKFMKDRVIGNILVTYQGEMKDKTSLFYIGNRKESELSSEMRSVAEVRWDKDFEEYDVVKDSLKGFDAECGADIRTFLKELNDSIK